VSLGIFSWLSDPSAEKGVAGERTTPKAEKEPTANESFFLIGQVQKPGKYPLPLNGRLSLGDALALAGGLTDVANARKVQVLRSEKLFIFNLNEKGSSVLLRPNDRVSVPEKLF
jgi:protein involved in polysaccharide export with SLBB domain